MAKAKKKGMGCLMILLIPALLAAGGAALVFSQSRPTESGKPFYIRLNGGDDFTSILQTLEDKGVIRDSLMAKFYLRLKGIPLKARSGTFQLNPGMTLEEVMADLQKPIRQMVRIPEGWWIKRVGAVLEKKEVCTQEEYMEAAADGARYQAEFEFPLPKGSLEGYLYPDTYDLPPLLGAEEVVRRQLKAFGEKVAPLLKDKNPTKILTVASMVELEAAKDSERPRIAGVIQNRLNKGQRLEIDATVLFALQEWKNLGPGVVRTVQSPYNTYLNDGLPPGPIGSPGLASVKGALAPEKHKWIYYVARPDKTHRFATEYSDHLSNIRLSRAEFKKAKEQGQ